MNEVRLPRAVQRQMERVNALQAAASANGSGTDPVVTDTPPATPSNTSTTPSADPQPPKKPADPRHSDPAYWEQRFRAVEGIVRKERDRHVQVEEALHQRIAELEEENATLKAQPATPSSSEIDLGKYFTPEVVERIGEDEAMSIARAAEKAAQTAADAAVARVEASLKPEREQRQREQQRREAQEYNDFAAALEAEIGDPSELDKDSAWLDWLGERDGDSAFTRQETLDRHKAARDVPALVKMVKAFRATKVEVPAPPITPQGDTVRTEVPLNQPKPTKQWIPAEVKDYFKRAALGRVTDQERAEFEAWYATTRRK